MGIWEEIPKEDHINKRDRERHGFKGEKGMLGLKNNRKAVCKR